MQQKILTFQVEEQCIRAPRCKVVSDSRNYLRARFSFSENWRGLTKTAVFQGADGQAYHMLLEDDSCVIPAEVITPTRFFVSVFGGDRLTTDRAVVAVEASGFAAGVTPPTPTPDIYAQLVSTVETERQLAEAAAVTAGEKTEVCTTAAVTAAVAADDATARANEASFYADQCSENADVAAKAAVTLQKAEEAAENFMEQLPDVAAGKSCYRVIEQNKQVSTGLWVGTKAEYDALPQAPENTLVFKTDDDTAERLTAAEESIAAVKKTVVAAQGDITSTQVELSVAQTDIRATAERVSAAEENITAAEKEIDTNTEKVAAAQADITATQTDVANLKNLVSKSYLISDSSAYGSSLMEWCNAHPKTGIQLAQLGAGAAVDAPAEYCLAFYACSSSLDRRTLWIIAPGGKIYARIYLDGTWQSWYLYSGTAFTV